MTPKPTTPQIFTPEQFQKIFWRSDQLAAHCNKIFSEWLSKQARVYGHNYPHLEYPMFWSTNLNTEKGKDGPEDTHQASLCNIQLLETEKKCEHEATQVGVLISGIQSWAFECVKCGAKLKPIGWEAINE